MTAKGGQGEVTDSKLGRDCMKKSGHRPKVTERFLMAEPEVLFGSAKISVPRRRILKNCETFQDNPDFLKFPYPIRTAVGEEGLRMFLAAVEGRPEFTTANMNDLFYSARSLVCGAFVAGFGIPVAARSGRRRSPQAHFLH
jgi:hypothetical protein